MGRKSKKKIDYEFLSDARRKFDRDLTNDRHNRQNYIDDLKFSNDENQWEEAIRQARQQDGRPCLSFNDLPSFVNRVLRGQKQNKPATKVRPLDSGATQEVAEIVEGKLREIKAVSSADVALEKAFESMVRGGFGALRLVTEYESDESFNRVIRVKPIENPLSVVWDASSVAWDRSDAFRLWVTSWMAKRRERPRARVCVGLGS